MAGARGELVGRELELTVERVAHGGVFVAHHEGRVVFVPDTVPGERIRAGITEDLHPGYLRADTLAVLEPSPDRQRHVWAAAALDRPPAERAGGAEFGHIAPEAQRALKRRVLIDALTRTGRLPPAEVDALNVQVLAVPGEPDGTRSRTRLKLHVDEQGRIGPYAARSRRVVSVEDLPLATVGLERAALAAGRLPGVRSLDVVAPSTGAAFVVAHPGGGGPATITERVVVDEHWVDEGRADQGGADERWNEFRLEPTGFWQVHPSAPAVLTAAVREALASGPFDPSAANLDLYGGVGLFAAAVAGLAGPTPTIATVEGDRRASEHAGHNLARYPAARAHADRVESFLRHERVRPDAARRSAVILDPPRSGAGAEVVDAIARRAPARIVYVACDPVALARDAARFAEHGYRIGTLAAFDLFPNTHHLEAVATLLR